MGDCGGTANGHASCEECERCPAGTYLSRRCSGQSLGTPDHSCEPCATCPVDHYVGACTSALQLTVAGDTSSSVEMARPADAGVCIPCKKCPEGSYISKRCSGTGLYDDVECLPCNTGCPQPGTYMHARCSGSTFTPDNDCRPCTPCSLGQYMSSGKCRSGGATNPMDRVCRDCGNCDVGEYKSSLCTGTLTYQVRVGEAIFVFICHVQPDEKHLFCICRSTDAAPATRAARDPTSASPAMGQPWLHRLPADCAQRARRAPGDTTDLGAATLQVPARPRPRTTTWRACRARRAQTATTYRRSARGKGFCLRTGFAPDASPAQGGSTSSRGALAARLFHLGCVLRASRGATRVATFWAGAWATLPI